MLRRIAYAETIDGTAAYTFDIDGAIWQVDEASFTSTQASLSTEVDTGIQTEFNIDWKQVKYSDLLKPLYSGIAAMLKISAYYTTAGTIPQSVNDQADYWSKHYTINTWQNATATYISASDAVDDTCDSPKTDVVFTVDSSGSIGSSNFELVKSFIEDVVDAFDISQQKVRVAVIEFSDDAYIQFDLEEYDTKEDVKAAVAAMPYYGDGTNSAAGLNATKVMIEQEGRQDDGVPVVTIFLTDGKSNDKTATEVAADDLHATLPQVTVFAIGVGSSPDMSELYTIASEPKCMHVYTLFGFDDITEFADQIISEACKAPAELTEDKEITGSVTEGQEYYFKIEVTKDEDGVYVQLKATSGGVKAYFSWSVQNPSEALYDETTEVSDGDGTVSVYIARDSGSTTRKKRAATSVNETAQDTPLYGSIVGAQAGQNDFTLSYGQSAADSGFQQTASLLSLLAAFLAVLGIRC